MRRLIDDGADALARRAGDGAVAGGQQQQRPECPAAARFVSGVLAPTRTRRGPSADPVSHQRNPAFSPCSDSSGKVAPACVRARPTEKEPDEPIGHSPLHRGLPAASQRHRCRRAIRLPSGLPLVARTGFFTSIDSFLFVSLSFTKCVLAEDVLGRPLRDHTRGRAFVFFAGRAAIERAYSKAERGEETQKTRRS